MFNLFFYEPIFNLLIVLYRLLGENLGLALISVALISRLITIPITNKQIQSAEKNKEFQEKYKEIKKKYENDKEKLAQEAAKLQAEYLPGQLGGCLPMILQFVMFFFIFRVLSDIFNKGTQAFNNVAYSFVEKFPEGAVIKDSFLGVINLGQSPSKVWGGSIGEVAPYIILILFVVVTQFFSMKIMMGTTNAKKKEEDGKDKKDKKKKGKEGAQEPDFGEIMQASSQQMMYVLPLVIGYASFAAPAGLSLYWTVQSTFVIIQRSITKRKEILAWIKAKINKK